MTQPTNLERLSEHVYYLPGAVNSALIVGDGKRAVIVDTGGDKEAGRRLKRACEQLQATPVAILNTHAHADHYGGNDFLVRAFGVPVYAPPFEASIIEAPYLEPVYLFGGAKPPSELLNKWLMAKPCGVTHRLQPGTLELAGLALEIIDTSGHAHTHVAVRVGDVLIAADAVFGGAVLDKYPLPFGQDIGAQRASAERVGACGCHIVLPGHGDPTEDAAALAEANLRAFTRAANAVRAASDGVSTEAVLKGTADALGITMHDLPRYYLNLCVVSAYLSYLRDCGEVILTLTDNWVGWRAA